MEWFLMISCMLNYVEAELKRKGSGEEEISKLWNLFCQIYFIMSDFQTSKNIGISFHFTDFLKLFQKNIFLIKIFTSPLNGRGNFVAKLIK